MSRARPAAALALSAAAVAVAGCSAGDVRGAAPTVSPATTPEPSATAAPPPAPTPTATGAPTASSGPACPSSYALPDPDRPVVRLSFRLAPDRRTVTGTEVVRARFDRPVTELVFRLWPNQPTSRAGGGDLTVSSVQLGGDAELARQSLERDRTLLRLRLRSSVAAGEEIQATLAFRLRLPVGANERWGGRAGVSWWGSGFPLLGWEPRVGWAEQPATRLFAEAATSEVFRLERLDVDVPAGDTVLATGTPLRSDRAGRFSFSAGAVRDVAVASGQLTVVRGTGSGGVPVVVGVAKGMTDSPRAVLAATLETFASHVRRLGPFPYDALSVPVVPDVKGGIEFPGLFYLGHNQLDATPSHELAHEWFYGLVGDNQARDPWLDEAFATYAEALARGTGSTYLKTSIPAAGKDRVGRPMSYWDSLGAKTYFRSVYVQGAAALLRARAAVGGPAFDRAIRCFVRASAHRIARPADLRRALAGHPAAVAILERAGALPRT